MTDSEINRAFVPSIVPSNKWPSLFFKPFRDTQHHLFPIFFNYAWRLRDTPFQKVKENNAIASAVPHGPCPRNPGKCSSSKVGPGFSVVGSAPKTSRSELQAFQCLFFTSVPTFISSTDTCTFRIYHSSGSATSRVLSEQCSLPANDCLLLLFALASMH
jgi:hypothetical protein